MITVNSLYKWSENNVACASAFVGNRKLGVGFSVSGGVREGNQGKRLLRIKTLFLVFLRHF